MNRRALLANAVLPAATAVPFTLVAVDPVGSRNRSRPEPSPDADLIALCEAYPARLATYLADDRDPDDNPFYAAYEAAQDAIGKAEPQTLAGMRAKALVAKLEATMPDGSEMPNGTVGGDWAWDLLQDILRLTGGKA